MHAGELVSKVTTGDQCSGRFGLQVCVQERGDGCHVGADGCQGVETKTSARRVSRVILSSKKTKCSCCSLLSLQSCEHGDSNRQTELISKAPRDPSSYSQEDRRRALTNMPCENNEAWISNSAFRLLEHVRNSNFEENTALPSPSSRLQSPTSPASLASERSWLKHYWLPSSLWSAGDVLFSSLNESPPSLCVCKVTFATLPSHSPLRLPVRASLMLSSVQFSYLVSGSRCDSPMVHSVLVSSGVTDILLNLNSGSAWVVSNRTRPTTPTPALQNTSPPLQTSPSYTPGVQATTSLPPLATRRKSAEQRVRGSNKYPSVAWLPPDHHTVRTRSTQRDTPTGSRKSCASSAAAQKVTGARTRCWSKHFLTSAVLMVAVLAAATTAYELKRE